MNENDPTRFSGGADSHDPIHAILADHITSGVYINEDPNEFKTWLEKTNKILDTAGPRYDICNAMLNDVSVTQSLLDLGLQGDNLRPPFCFEAIDGFFAAHFGEEKRLTTQQTMTKDQISVLGDPESARHQKVSKQLSRSKKSPAKTVDDLIESYKVKLLSINDRLVELAAARATSSNGELFEAAVQACAGYKTSWFAADAAMGEEAGENGRKLEQRCNEIVPMVANVANVEVAKVWTNCDWNDKLGEVDIVLQTKNNEYVLVEVKSRVFDVMAGWLQSGCERHPDKRTLVLSGVPAPVHMPRNVRCFVVTILPPRPYVLKCESLLKSKVLTYVAKHPEVTMEELWERTRDAGFSTRLNPLEWYHKHRGLVILLSNDGADAPPTLDTEAVTLRTSLKAGIGIMFLLAMPTSRRLRTLGLLVFAAVFLRRSIAYKNH